MFSSNQLDATYPVSEDYDSTLYTKDGNMFRVHWHKMASCSSYFAAIYGIIIHSVPWRDFEIPGVTSAALCSTIDYVYGKEVFLDWMNIEEIYRAANQFKIAGLQEICCRFLSKELRESNCLHLIQLAKKIRCTSIEEVARRFLLVNLKEVIQHFSQSTDIPLWELLNICGVSGNTNADPEMINQYQLMDPSVYRRHYCCVVHNQCLYVIGGNIGGKFLSSCRVLDLASRVWQRMAPLRQNRSSASAIEMGKEVFVIGGMGNDGPLRSVESYREMAMKWTSLPSMFYARLKPLVITSGDKIIVMGGRINTGTPPSCRSECYDKIHKQWTVVDLIATLPPERHMMRASTFKGYNTMNSQERREENHASETLRKRWKIDRRPGRGKRIQNRIM